MSSENTAAPKLGVDLIENPQTLAEFRQNGLMPRPVTKDIVPELEALFRERDEAVAKGNWDALFASEDFPVMVLTDTHDGEVLVDEWDLQKNAAVGGRAGPHFPRVPVEHSRTFIPLSDEMALSIETSWLTLNGERAEWKAANVLVKRDGKWRNKAILESGFGDFLRGQGFLTGNGKGSR